MKKKRPLILWGSLTAFFLSMTLTATAIDNPKKPYWQDVQVVAVNKEYPRTAFMTYDSKATALTGKFENSKY